MDSGEEAGAQIMVKVLILAHFKNLFPLFHRHLVFNAFCSLFFISELFSTKLKQMKYKKNPKSNKSNNTVTTEIEYCRQEVTKTCSVS